MPAVSLIVTEKRTVSQNRALVKVHESKTTRETRRRGVMYNDKVTFCTVRQVLFLVVKSRNTTWTQVLHIEEMRHGVQGSAHVTKSEVARPLGRPMLKVREHVDIRVCPNKSCTRILTG